jgi:hypothetical protein
MSYGQFNIPGNTQVEYDFPCPEQGCDGVCVGKCFIKPESHSDEKASCDKCGKNYDVTVVHDAGTGTVNADDSRVDPKTVNANGVK